MPKVWKLVKINHTSNSSYIHSLSTSGDLHPRTQRFDDLIFKFSNLFNKKVAIQKRDDPESDNWDWRIRFWGYNETFNRIHYSPYPGWFRLSNAELIPELIPGAGERLVLHVEDMVELVFDNMGIIADLQTKKGE